MIPRGAKLCLNHMSAATTIRLEQPKKPGIKGLHHSNYRHPFDVLFVANKDCKIFIAISCALAGLWVDIKAHLIGPSVTRFYLRLSAIMFHHPHSDNRKCTITEAAKAICGPSFKERKETMLFPLVRINAGTMRDQWSILLRSLPYISESREKQLKCDRPWNIVVQPSLQHTFFTYETRTVLDKLGFQQVKPY